MRNSLGFRPNSDIRSLLCFRKVESSAIADIAMRCEPNILVLSATNKRPHHHDLFRFRLGFFGSGLTLRNADMASLYFKGCSERRVDLVFPIRSYLISSLMNCFSVMHGIFSFAHTPGIFLLGRFLL